MVVEMRHDVVRVPSEEEFGPAGFLPAPEMEAIAKELIAEDDAFRHPREVRG